MSAALRLGAGRSSIGSPWAVLIAMIVAATGLWTTQLSFGADDAYLAALRDAVEHQRELHGADHGSIVAALIDLGDALMTFDQPAGAHDAYQLAVEMRTRLAMRDGVRVDAWALAEAVARQAFATVAVGRPADALALHEDALAMRRRLARDADNILVASSLDDLASCLHQIGRSRNAVAVAEEALAMLRRLDGDGDHPAVAQVMGTLAAAHAGAGRADLALPIQEEAVQMLWRLEGDEPSVDGVMSMVNLAHGLHLAGRSADADRWIGRALGTLALLPPTVGGPQRVAALQVAASIRATFGRTDDAVAALREALTITRALHIGEHPDLAGLHVDLGALLGAAGRHEHAADELIESVAMMRRLGRAAHPDLAVALFALAQQEAALGDLLTARSRLEESLAILESVIGDEPEGADHPLITQCLIRLSFVTSELGDRAGAITIARRAAESALRHESPAAMIAAANLGWLLIDDEQLAEAAEWLTIAAARNDAWLESAGGTELEQLALAAVGSAFGIGDGLAWISAQALDPEAAIGQLERGRSRTLRALLERGRRAARGGLVGSVIDLAHNRRDEALTTEATGLRDALAAAAAALAAADHETGEAARAHYATVRRDALALVDRHLPIGLEPATIERMRDALGPDEVILIYLIMPHAGVVFAVGDPRTVGVQQHGLLWPEGTPVTAASLRDAIGRHLSGIMIEGRLTRGIGRERAVSAPVGAKASHRLFRALLPEPLWRDIGESSVVHVIPDASMHRLPFETLVITEPALDAPAASRHYWIDDGPMLTYAPSATVLLDRATARDAQRARFSRVAAQVGPHPSLQLLAVGDPIFARELIGSDATRVELDPLPGTRAELGAIVSLICPESALRVSDASLTPVGSDRVIALLGESATRGELMRQLDLLRASDVHSAPRVLHVATHGIVESGPRALQSRLALTVPVAPAAPVDTDLSLMDLLEGWAGRLAETELVILSACDSVGGDSAGQNLRGGEGIFGLPWGFMYAGAPAVIASLWAVDDASTATLMERLYGELDWQLDRSLELDEPHLLRAFTNARRTMRAIHPDPYHWAPFVFIGDGRSASAPLREQ